MTSAQILDLPDLWHCQFSMPSQGATLHHTSLDVARRRLGYFGSGFAQETVNAVEPECVALGCVNVKVDVSTMMTSKSIRLNKSTATFNLVYN